MKGSWQLKTPWSIAALLPLALQMAHKPLACWWSLFFWLFKCPKFCREADRLLGQKTVRGNKGFTRHGSITGQVLLSSTNRFDSFQVVLPRRFLKSCSKREVLRKSCGILVPCRFSWNQLWYLLMHQTCGSPISSVGDLIWVWVCCCLSLGLVQFVLLAAVDSGLHR